MLKNVAIIIGALAVGQASAHLIMIEPHPYNLDTPPLLQVSPLGAEIPFPCQNKDPKVEKTTTMTAGSTALVKFQGSAVHGGGSCQFSVAYGDAPPDDASQWKVIYSIIGGCPAEAEGNLQDSGTDPAGRVTGPECGNDSGKECLRQFNIPIPKEMKNGKAIFAWTWFNKIGNREMYMNCAPIEITGGSDDSKFMDSLPAMFQANIPGQCSTGNGILGFPDPGKYGKENDPITPESNGACKAPSDPNFEDSPAGGDSSQPAGSGTQATQTAPATASSVASTPATVVSDTPTQASSMVTSAVVSSVEQPATTQEMPATSAAASQTPVASSGSGTSGGSASCSTNGALVCISETQFGICNNGVAVAQDVAAGTACRDGAIVVA